MIHKVPGRPPKLSTVKGWNRIKAGIAGNRLFIPLQSFFRIPFVNASTRPAARKAKIVCWKAFDWKDAVRSVFPKILPVPMNSRKMASRIHSPQAMADSHRSSPYSASVFPERACLAHRRPTRNTMIQSSVVSAVPRTAKPTRKAEAQTEPEAIYTQS